MDTTTQRSNFYQILKEQIQLLTEWNKKNINKKPEQVRKNAETVLNIIEAIKNHNL